jgi:hypothetical protein
MAGTAGEFEKLAYEAALRGLDKQEQLLEELRARTGALLAAAALAASFLGQRAFEGPAPRGLAIAVLASFVVSIGSSVYVLLPKRALVFAGNASELYDSLYGLRDQMSEVYRRLAYDVGRFCDENEPTMERVSDACSVAAVALVGEVLTLVALLAGRVF